MCITTFLNVGILYGGSSITKGAGSPLNLFVRFKIIPAIITTTIEIRYIIGAIQGAPLNIKVINMANIGSFAPHGINGVSNIVIRLSASDSIVLVAITPGIEQPVPISIGMKLLPDRPNFLNSLSMMKATLAI